MPNNDFYTIENPTGIFIMLNRNGKEVYLCENCMVPEDSGYVKNTEDCKHGEIERERTG